ncbi:tyrosine-protein kinase receptor ver-3-like [Paramacrobiotus metropolitanus]|uniref:tyrosine-protein kinase receptor ver-3-like n=1 Tax=Paramacrobiotus metropolitanus TaxID=2943436 RepID=UPI0024459952|nr:tyrosine-protein kinase receptor ver-3-like [Paramacrobiotus metropolitanus]
MLVSNRLLSVISVFAWIIFLGCNDGVFCEEEATEIFHDDFQTLNLEKWVVSNEHDATEDSNFDPSNVFAKNGLLTLKSARERHDAKRSRINAAVTTKDSFKYGQILIRGKHPHVYAVDSSACSLLMLVPIGNKSFPNTSIGACAATPILITAHQTYVTVAGEITTYGQTFMSDTDLTTDYHTYRLVWTEELMELYMDDIRLFNLTVPGLENWPAMRIRLMIGFPDLPNLRSLSQERSPVTSYEFLVDYVIVVQQYSGLRTNSVTLRIALGVALPLTILVSGGFIYLLVRRARCRRAKRRNIISKTVGLPRSSSHYDATTLERNAHVLQLLQSESVKAREITLQNLQITNIILGRGTTSVVRKGVATGLSGYSDPVGVAVKSARDTSDPVESRQLLQELKIMAAMPHHEHLLQLLGVVIRGDLLLVLEYSRFGCLKNMLKTYGIERFYNHVDADGAILPYDDDEAERIKLASDRVVMRRDEMEELDGEVLSTQTFLHFAHQISQGMQFLSTLSIVHRDLAARNILICDGYVAKISDFGMARMATECSVEDHKEALPVRWMPPEAIVEKLYSEKSDVWAFGVLLWEMFSLGALPYAEVHVSTGNKISDFLASLKTGLRLGRPAACPNAIYSLMGQCWQLLPNDRPNFGCLTQSLRGILEDACTQIYHRLDYRCLQPDAAKKGG